MKLRQLWPMVVLAFMPTKHLGAQNSQLSPELRAVVDTAQTEEAVFGPFLTNAITEGGGIKRSFAQYGDVFYSLNDGSRVSQENGPGVTVVTHHYKNNPDGYVYKSLASGDSPSDGTMVLSSRKEGQPNEYITVTLPKMAKNVSATSDTAFIDKKLMYLLKTITKNQGVQPKESETHTKDGQGNLIAYSVRYDFLPKTSSLKPIPYIVYEILEDGKTQIMWNTTDNVNNRCILSTGLTYDSNILAQQGREVAKKVPVSQLTLNTLNLGLQ